MPRIRRYFLYSAPDGKRHRLDLRSTSVFQDVVVDKTIPLPQSKWFDLCEVRREAAAAILDTLHAPSICPSIAAAKQLYSEMERAYRYMIRCTMPDTSMYHTHEMRAGDEFFAAYCRFKEIANDLAKSR
ncbi:MAG: hypothetical protein IKZ87_03595 [Actinomycetaceae bacterium]|nr:hypothetical protein [Actinomycetaceae bacterium]